MSSSGSTQTSFAFDTFLDTDEDIVIISSKSREVDDIRSLDIPPKDEVSVSSITKYVQSD